jgi:hypothetical protein
VHYKQIALCYAPCRKSECEKKKTEKKGIGTCRFIRIVFLGRAGFIHRISISVLPDGLKEKRCPVSGFFLFFN